MLCLLNPDKSDDVEDTETDAERYDDNWRNDEDQIGIRQGLNPSTSIDSTYTTDNQNNL